VKEGVAGLGGAAGSGGDKGSATNPDGGHG
jgi:hypothetical protein